MKHRPSPQPRPSGIPDTGATAPEKSGKPDRPTVRPMVVEAGYPEAWRVELHNVTFKMSKLKRRQAELVMQAVVAGATWSAIASVLGITRQSAHQRFAHIRAYVDSKQPPASEEVIPSPEGAATAAPGRGSTHP